MVQITRFGEESDVTLSDVTMLWSSGNQLYGRAGHPSASRGKGRGGGRADPAIELSPVCQVLHEGYLHAGEGQQFAGRIGGPR